MGVVFDIRRYSIHDGPGIRTTVFMKGCPLSCWWCHNPEGISFKPELRYRPERCVSCGACVGVCPTGATTTVGGFQPMLCNACGACADVCPSGAREIAGNSYSVNDIVRITMADEPFYDSSCGGVTFSGGEPLSQPAFVIAAARALKEHRIRVTIDTSGFTGTDTIIEVSKDTNLFLYDLKYMNDETHQLMTGVSNKIIHDNIRVLADNGADVMVSVPLVPGCTDDEANLSATARFIVSLKPSGRSTPYPVRILPYHDSARSKYARMSIPYRCESTPVPDATAINRAIAIFLAEGIDAVTGGL
ncbi:MAG: glycyl-radical enzyme activating protein [Spirochaetales bacterium]|nr:glycyl-radical enzyme activating protein [Spirochaetales bacterium]